MEERGPFDQILQSDPAPQRDRTATFIVAAGIVLGVVLLVLVLPPVSIFDSDDDGSVTGPITVRILDELPPPPAGFEAVSPMFEVSSSDPVGPGARPRLTVNLSGSVDENELLVLFTHRDGDWRRLANAVVVADGTAAQGEVPVLPENVAVFRAVEFTRVILGSLPAGSEADPRALTALTALNVEGFSPASTGGIVGSVARTFEELGVPVAPTISARTPAEVQALNAILASSELSDVHVQAIVDFARVGGVAGIDLDYQTIDPTFGEEFTAFVRRLSGALRSDARSLSIALPLPVQQGGSWDTLGYEWEELTALVDAVKVAPEIEQDRYYGRMDDALGYLTSRVASSKLLLTLTPYSHERGVDGVRELTLTDALALASTPVTQPEGSVAAGESVQALGLNVASETGASGLRWDDESRAVAFSYTGPGGARVVWLTNLFSAAFKLDLARRYQLGGVAVQDISQETSDANIWAAVLPYAQAGEVQLVKPNGGLLVPSWTVSGGTLDSASGPVVTWNTPEETGTYTLTLVVSDGVLRVGQELQVPVQPRQQAVAP